MAELLSALELELRIALLPPISRASPFNGARLHAQRLIEAWKVDDDDDVPLRQGYRLLDAEAVAGAILRVLTMGDKDYASGDPGKWQFPCLEDLLPELHELTWQAILAGMLLAEGVGEGKSHDIIPLTALPRLRPDMELSRLTFGGRDEFIAARVRRTLNTLVAVEAPDVAAFTSPLIASGTLVATEGADVAAFAGPLQKPWMSIKPTWRPEKPSRADLEDWLKDLAKQDYSDAEHRPDRRPTFKVLQAKANDHFKTKVPRDDLRAAIDHAAPQLRRSPGQHT
jgi:hypothetical protein